MTQKFALIMGLAAAAMPANAQTQRSSTPTPTAAPANNHYSAYDWLVGDWYGKAGPGLLRELITYGPNRSYIRFSVFTAPSEAAAQHLHFEGIALWNGKTRMLDYLFAVEPGSGVQEQGTFRADADGTIIRDVEMIDARGRVGTFRQTFRRTGPDSAITSVMRRTESGWVPTFPGGDRIELSRRPSQPAPN